LQVNALESDEVRWFWPAQEDYGGILLLARQSTQLGGGDDNLIGDRIKAPHKKKGNGMAQKFICDRCGGMEIEERNEDELVQKVQEHAQEKHNERAERQQILSRSQST
jgi:predicted small metal-binding protein